MFRLFLHFFAEVSAVLAFWVHGLQPVAEKLGVTNLCIAASLASTSTHHIQWMALMAVHYIAP